MYDQYVDLPSLVQNDPLFEFLYMEAANDAASIFQYGFRMDPDALEAARDLFSVLLYDHYDIISGLASWERKTSLIINLLVKAVAAYPIISYRRPVLHERVSRDAQPTLTPAFNPVFVKEQTNSLVALVFCTTILSMEMSRYLRAKGYFAVNVEALRHIPLHKIRKYVSIIEDDRRKGVAAKKKLRRDLRITWYIKHLLKKDLLARLNP